VIDSPTRINTGRIRELDGLRGVAVLSIVFLHYFVHHIQSQPGTPIAYAQKYLMFLWVGVDAFFVLSGFLIGGILLDQKHALNYFRVFYLRRALRILPPYFFLLAFWWLAQRLTEDHLNVKWLMEPHVPFWPYLLYVQNFWMAAQNSIGPLFVGITWSLAIEEQFYLLFPLLIRFLPAPILPRMLLYGALFAPLGRLGCALLGGNWHEAQSHLLPTRWDSLLVGALVAWAVRSPEALEWIRARRKLAWLTVSMSGLVMVLYPCVSNREGNLGSLVDSFALYTIIAVFFGSVLLLLNLGWLPRIAGMLSSRLLCFFGRISYSVYLFHVAILGLMFPLLRGTDPVLSCWQDAGVMAGAFFVTIGLAQLTWLLFERRLIRLGHGFVYRVSRVS